MPASSKYNYIDGTAARKLSYEDYSPKKKKVVVKNRIKAKVKRKTSIKPAILVASLFTMLMIVTYRYNVISEKNLSAINLKNSLTKVESNLAATKMTLEQNTNLDQIEAYAKQKLGMQKPDKNQVVYVDTSENSNVIKEEATSFINQITEKIGKFLNNINSNN